MTGISGAEVVVVGARDVAIKIDTRMTSKLAEQGQWLIDNQAEHLPFVHAMLPSGYVMESLTHINIEDVELPKVVASLTESVWKYAPRNLVDAPQTMLKAARILERFAPQLVEPALHHLAFIRTTEDCLTHGDPTAENVMLRGDTYVIIDPLPSTEAVPDDIAVDVGKMLQSAHGWEDMKGEKRSSWSPELIAACFTPEVFEVAELWCIVHFIRTLPYANWEVRADVVLKLHELLGV